MAVPATAQDSPDQGACDGPKNIRATAVDHGIFVEWDEWEPARAYDVYRAEGDGEFVVVAKTNGDNPEDGDANETHGLSFFDADVEAGVTYTYYVQAYGPPPHMSDICGSATATAHSATEVPFFTGPLALGMGAVGLLGAAIVMGRRK
ncbi:MAG TPA: hypothetical protein VFH47_03570 [Candidatus Thermoplasmatota archaeon]|nr:hypothetical protein [Candidatus Thermoplasmatota archaeon]